MPITKITEAASDPERRGHREHLDALQDSGGGGGAPTDSQYVVLDYDAGLSAERKLTAGDNITISDGGANNPVTIAATPKHNHGATTDPTSGDDSDDGYSVGSVWVNTVDGEVWVCVDATVAAAAWFNTVERTGGTNDSRIAVWNGSSNNQLKQRGIGINSSNSVIDANNNELMETAATGSAVNHVKLTNAATGNGPTLESVGTDTDVDFNITSQGAGQVVVGNAGDIELGDGTERNLKPNTTKKINLGTASLLFNKAWLDKCDVTSSLNAPYSTANVADPPTTANLNSAFASAEQGFIGIVNDAGAGTDVWLVVYDGSAWYYLQLTAA